jgi:hypothetical protein
LFDNIFYAHEGLGTDNILGDEFRFSIDDLDAPHYPIPVFEDERYRLFDPVQKRTQLTRDLYQKSFGPFVEFCVERMQLNDESDQ